MSKLTAEAVGKIFIDCLFREEELQGIGDPTGKFVEVQGIVNRFGFHPERLESHRQEVKELLAELPDNFHQDKGGGWTFLNACMTKDGEQWGEHLNMEQLFALGIGLKLAKWQLTEMQKSLPGGMPYVVILKT